MDRSVLRLGMVVLTIVGLAACGEDGATDPESFSLLTAVSPQGGSVNVARDRPVTIEFTHPVLWGAFGMIFSFTTA